MSTKNCPKAPGFITMELSKWLYIQFPSGFGMWKSFWDVSALMPFLSIVNMSVKCSSFKCGMSLREKKKHAHPIAMVSSWNGIYSVCFCGVKNAKHPKFTVASPQKLWLPSPKLNSWSFKINHPKRKIHLPTINSPNGILGTLHLSRWAIFVKKKTTKVLHVMQDNIAKSLCE